MHAAVVDPSRVVLRLLKELISERGDTVSEFLNSASALRAVQTDTSIDVLITSLEVQPLTGLELCWAARLAAPARRPLYIIVMSSLSDEQKLAEALDSGADDLIAKPVKRLELHARLRMAGRMKAAQLHLVDLAERDPLSGLLNRRAFFERLNPLLLAPKSAPLSAILIDIDHFKRVNDTYGHDTGDTVIKTIAMKAGQHADLACRMGGEEFAMILERQDETAACRLANGLRREFAGLSFQARGEKFSVTCSFGVSALMEGDGVDELLKRADVALYQAKLAGRNRVYRANEFVAFTEEPVGVTRTHPRG